MARYGTLRRSTFRNRTFGISSCLFLLVFLSNGAHALNPSRFLSQYGHTAWRIQDGELPGTVFPVAQTVDGYLWIGSRMGALRFDGAHFVSLEKIIGKPVVSAPVVSLLGTADGDLWIGTTAGLSRWSHGTLTNFPDVHAGARSLLEDAQHRIWFVTIASDGSSLCEIVKQRAICHGKDENLDLPGQCCDAMGSDGRGNFVISTDDAIVRWRSGTHSDAFRFDHKIEGGFTGTPRAVFDASGSLYVGVPDPGRGLGLQRIVANQWHSFEQGGVDGSTLSVQYLLLDRENTLWIGTNDRGLFRCAEDRVDHFGSAEGLSSDYVQYIFEDSDGTVWVTTSQGLDRFRDLRVASFTKREGINSDEVDSVIARRDGAIWIGTPFTLDVLQHNRVRSIGAKEGKPGLQVMALLEDHAGRLWVGIDNTLMIYANEKFSAVPGLNGNTFGFVNALAEDTNGDIWATARADSRKLVHLQHDKATEEFADPVVPTVTSIAADPKSGVWLGLLNGNLIHRRTGEMETFSQDKKNNPLRKLLVTASGRIYGATAAGLATTVGHNVLLLTSQQGLPCDEIFGMVEDDRQQLWLEMACGIVSIAQTDITHALADPHYVMPAEVMSVFDGVRAGRAPFNVAARSSDGRLWFANGINLQTLDPASLPPLRIPPVYILQVVADHEVYSSMLTIELPALTRDLQFDYTAPDLAAPQRLRFRYRLEGHDQSWVDAGARRQAFYTDLPPGNYRFDVSTSEDGKHWSEAPAALPFAILPAFYQTRWFAMLSLIAAGLLIWAVVAWQIHQIKARLRTRFEAQSSERERIARELHDTFLQGVQGLMLHFQSAMEKIPPSQPARQLMESALEHADAVLVEGRERVTHLRSLHRTPINFPKSLQDMGDELARDTSVSFAVTVEGTPHDLNADVADEVRHVASEAMANAFRHARAKRVDLTIIYARHALTINIDDDGRGFAIDSVDSSEAAGHWGLRGMHERAAKLRARLSITSRLGHGTAINLVVPARRAYEVSSRDERPRRE